jgi:hypothetical protein
MDALRIWIVALAMLLGPGCVPADGGPAPNLGPEERFPLDDLDDDDDGVTLEPIANLESSLVEFQGEAPEDPDDPDDPADDDDDDDDDDDPADDDDPEEEDDPGEDDPDQEDEPEEEEDPDGIPEEEEDDPDDPDEEPPAEEEEPPPDAVCIDDLHEENDQPDDAGYLMEGYYGAMTACDDDWFAFDLVAGDLFSIELSSELGDGDLELHLYDGLFNLVDSSTTGADESVEHIAVTNGTYLIHVEFVSDSGPDLGVAYSLSVGWEENDCGNDGFEPNDSDLAPWPVPAGVMTLNVCPSGDDYFAVWLEVGGTLTAEVSFDLTEADLDLTLYAVGGVWAAESSSGTDLETASVTATTAGYHVVWIELVTDVGSELGTEYELLLDAP